MIAATVIIFAKAPEPGKVKTRLTTQLSPEQAAQIHERLVLHTLNTISLVPGVKAELWCAPTSEHPFFRYCEENFPISLREQQGEDLGQRMHQAISDALDRSQQCLIIGTDCPQLESKHILNTIEQLKAGKDCVITPAKDGGYVMLGLKKTDAHLFSNISWGADSVLKETLIRLNNLGWDYSKQEALNDIDHPEDLALLKHIPLPEPLDL